MSKKRFTPEKYREYFDEPPVEHRAGGAVRFRPNRGKFTVCADVVRTGATKECEHCGGRRPYSEFKFGKANMCELCRKLADAGYESRYARRGHKPRHTMDTTTHPVS